MANPTEVNSPQEMLDQWKDFRQQVLQYLESIPDAEFAAAPEAGGVVALADCRTFVFDSMEYGPGPSGHHGGKNRTFRR